MQPRELDKQAAIEDHHWWFKARRRLLKRGFKLSVEGTKAEILEIGAASGGNFSVCRQFGTYHALDLSAHALDLCKKKGVANLIHSNACSIPRDAASFDVVVAFDILEHIEEDERALREIFRVLKPGGMLLANVPAFQWMFSDHDRVFEHVRRYQRGELEDKVKSAGFEVEYRGYWSFFVFAAVFAVRYLSQSKKKYPGTGSDFDRPIPRIAEWVLGVFANIETSLCRRGVSLPVGVSLLVFARKPV